VAAFQSPGLATGYEATAVSAPTCLGHDIELRQIAVVTLLFQHKEVTGGIMGKRPAYRLFIVLRDEEDAVPFGAAMLQFAPMLDDIACVAAAIRFKDGFIVLQAPYEGQDCRFVGGQTCWADTNGRAP
jgi:hypothetical protein